MRQILLVINILLNLLILIIALRMLLRDKSKGGTDNAKKNQRSVQKRH